MTSPLLVHRYPPLVATISAAELAGARVCFVWRDKKLPSYISIPMFNDLTNEIARDNPNWNKSVVIIDALMKKHTDFVDAKYPNGVRTTFQCGINDTGLTYEDVKVMMGAFIYLWVSERLPDECGVAVLCGNELPNKSEVPKKKPKDKTKGKKGRRKY